MPNSTIDFTTVIRTAGAARRFTPEPVSREVLYRILDNARFAPSGGNRQGWRVIVIDDPAIRRSLRDLYVLSWREYSAHVSEGKVPFAPGEDRKWNEPAVDLETARTTAAPNSFADQLDQVPVLMAVAVDLTQLAVVDNGLDRQSIVGGGSIYPFCHNILLAARAEGLGGVLTTAVCRQEEAVRELLAIPDPWAVAGLIALGHPARQVTRLRRRPVEEFTFIDAFEGPALNP